MLNIQLELHLKGSMYGFIQDRKIRGLLEGCSLEHEARMEAFTGRVRDRVLSDARWKQLQLESNKAVWLLHLDQLIFYL